MLLATAAGAPFLPKLVQAAEGNVAMGVGLMVLLMVVTVIYMPLVLPLLLLGVAVDAWAITQALIMPMLIPLGLALLVRARLPETAATWQPVMNKVSTVWSPERAADLSHEIAAYSPGVRGSLLCWR